MQSLISSFDNTVSGLYRTSLAPLKLAQIFSFMSALLKAALKAARKFSFLTQLTLKLARPEILSPYALLNSEKYPTSNGYKRYEE